MQSKNFLFIIFPIFFSIFLTSPVFAKTSPTITFSTTTSSAIFSRDGYDLHAYSKPAGKITYSLKSGSNIATINQNTGLVIPTSVGQIEVRACVQETETISAGCSTKKFTIRPFSRSNIIGEKENIIKNTSIFIYKIANTEISPESGKNLTIGDFLNESFSKTEASSGVFQIVNKTFSTKTEKLRLTSSIERSTSNCTISDIYQYCDAYEIFDVENIVTTTITFEIENITKEDSSEEVLPISSPQDPKNETAKSPFPTTPDTSTTKTKTNPNFNIYIIYMFVFSFFCIYIVYKNHSSVL